MSVLDSASSLREKLERRRTKAATTGLQRVPFMLDSDLADAAEALGRRVAALEDRLETLADLAADAPDDDPEADRRASGHDLTPSAVEIAGVRDELERARAELSEAVDAARDDQVILLFRRATADEYEQLIRKHVGADARDGSAEERAFLAALTARCFVGVEMADGSRETVDWPSFVEQAQLTMGELAPIQALVYASNARCGNSVPFSSASSRKTKTS